MASETLTVFNREETDFINAAFENVLFNGGFNTNCFADIEAYNLALSIYEKSKPQGEQTKKTIGFSIIEKEAQDNGRS